MKTTAGALAGGLAVPLRVVPGAAAIGMPPGYVAFDPYFRQMVEGFLRHARNTAPGYAVCDFPQGTMLESCSTPSGKTYVSVARMLPVLGEWLASERRPTRFSVDGESIDLNDVVLEIFRNAFDPEHPQYWGEPRPDKPTQRVVEAALVAYALCQMRDRVLPRLTSRQRANIQRWLASCTTLPERKNNHAWFTCTNQAARIQLSRTWPEFSGDEAWMVADLEALDALLTPDGSGWYSDSPDIPIYDYYNFWTFANFPLLWSQIAGRHYPEWNERFSSRVKLFLQNTPYFFAPDGSHPLFGRSLLYRWALLSPMLLGYRQGLWPHSPGLLRRIVRSNLEFYWKMGSFDEELGKLRETLSVDGTPDIREVYIDNGHPYWCTLGMMMYSIPADDPFWTAPEELLPVEKEDFVVRFEGPRMMLAGTKSSGQIRWLQARSEPKFYRHYRDLYIKFAASSHFPFNVIKNQDRCPWDETLVFRDPVTGMCVGRVDVIEGELLEDGTQTLWRAELDGLELRVRSRIRLAGEFEERTHLITAPAGLAGRRIEILEGSHALGLQEEEKVVAEEGEGWRCTRSSISGYCVATWNISGHRGMEISEWFDESRRTRVNIIYPRMVVNTLLGDLSAGSVEVSSLHYASPRPLEREELLRKGEERVARWRSAPLAAAGHPYAPRQPG